MSAAVRAFVALGSNLGDRGAHLEGALAALASTPGVRLAAASAAFENPAVGGPPQGPFWNAVAEVSTTLAPRPFLRRLREIEDAAGRARAVTDGPRTLDLDLLAHGDTALADPDLVLPHPRALARAFVLHPWSEIAPEAIVPGTQASVLAHRARRQAADPASFASLARAAVLTPRPSPATTTRRPRVLSDHGALGAWRREAGGVVGFVPTMGALHEGHAALARRARAGSDVVLASLFVNPLQFGPNEDYSRYPRTFEADLDLLGREGVDAVYAPAAPDLYPPGFSTSVRVAGPSAGFEGAARPGHFEGVATVVLKLLLRTGASRAWFGRKDGQQVAVVRRLVRDLDLPVEIVVAPTVRDVDGLALSSRNRFLAPDDRVRARAIPEALDAAVAAAALGERDAACLVALVRGRLEADPLRAPAYVEVVDPDSFEPVSCLPDAPALLVTAVRVGTTRLLDNAWMMVGSGTDPR